MGDKVWSCIHGLWLRENSRGVAMLANWRWSRRGIQLQRASERICQADVGVPNMNLRLVAAYFPHGGNGDKRVQKLCDDLAQTRVETRNNKFDTALGCDFNARI
eukprot:2644822-Pyramimonas_sp.AAC.1